MALLKWIGCVILACLIVVAILGVLFMIRVLAFVLIVGACLVLVAWLLCTYFNSGDSNKPS